MPVGQYGITGIVFIGPPERFAAAHCHRMIRPCSPFRIHYVIIAVFFIKVGAFRPDHISHGAIPHILMLTHQLHLLNIQFLNPDIPVAIIFAPFRIGMCANIITFPVIVKKQTGVDSIRALDIIWLRPGPFRTRCGHNIVPPMGYIGTYHIKHPVMITNGGRKQSRRMLRSLQGQLRFPVHGIPDLFPMSQITTVHNR